MNSSIPSLQSEVQSTDVYYKKTPQDSYERVYFSWDNQIPLLDKNSSTNYYKLVKKYNFQEYTEMKLAEAVTAEANFETEQQKYIKYSGDNQVSIQNKADGSGSSFEMTDGSDNELISLTKGDTEIFKVDKTNLLNILTGLRVGSFVVKNDDNGFSIEYSEEGGNN